MPERILVERGEAMIAGVDVAWPDTFVTVTPPASGNRIDRVYIDMDGEPAVQSGPPAGRDERPRPPTPSDQALFLDDIWHVEQQLQRGPPTV